GGRPTGGPGRGGGAGAAPPASTAASSASSPSRSTVVARAGSASCAPRSPASVSAWSSEMYSPRSASSWLSSTAATARTAACTRSSRHSNQPPGSSRTDAPCYCLSLALQRLAGLGNSQRPAARRPPLLHDVSCLVRNQLGAIAGAGVVFPRPEVDVAANRERPRRHGAGKRGGVIVGV